MEKVFMSLCITLLSMELLREAIGDNETDSILTWSVVTGIWVVVTVIKMVTYKTYKP